MTVCVLTRLRLLLDEEAWGLHPRKGVLQVVVEVVLKKKKANSLLNFRKWAKIRFLFYQVREKVPHVSPEVGEVFSVADPGKAIRFSNGTKYCNIQLILSLPCCQLEEVYPHPLVELLLLHAQDLTRYKKVSFIIIRKHWCGKTALAR